MEHSFGWLAILPPIIAITLAITTKEILLSLFLGVFSGGLILSGYDPVGALTKTLKSSPTALEMQNLESASSLLLFFSVAWWVF